MWLIRLFTGIILTSLGILWNDKLLPSRGAIEYLKFKKKLSN